MSSSSLFYHFSSSIAACFWSLIFRLTHSRSVFIHGNSSFFLFLPEGCLSASDMLQALRYQEKLGWGTREWGGAVPLVYLDMADLRRSAASGAR